jgi:hypothetical protein
MDISLSSRSPSLSASHDNPAAPDKEPGSSGPAARLPAGANPVRRWLDSSSDQTTRAHAVGPAKAEPAPGPTPVGPPAIAISAKRSTREATRDVRRSPRETARQVELKPALTSLPPEYENHPSRGDALLSYVNALYRPSEANAYTYMQWCHTDPVTSTPSMTGCVGMNQLAQYMAADRHTDLMGAVRQISSALLGDLGTQAQADMQHAVETAQTTYTSGGSISIPNHIRQVGTYMGNLHLPGEDAANLLIDHLRRRFSQPAMTEGALFGSPVAFANISFGLVNPRTGGRVGGHQFGIQRLHQTADYRNDGYQIYDNGLGAFRYANFDQLGAALRMYFAATGLQVRDLTTDYQAMLHVVQQPNMGAATLQAVGGGYGANPLHNAEPGAYMTLTPPDATLPPPPSLDAPSRWGTRDDTLLKRSIHHPFATLHPHALYRPSAVSPGELKTAGGFTAEDTPLRNVNLDYHDFELQRNPKATDGAGYLGTFRSVGVATQKMPDGGGYLYVVAPTPNMVDVPSSLRLGLRRPGAHEVAALGRIDYTQIRGWYPVEKSGKRGDFVVNDDYRWDIYDRTQLAGGQPQLARFAGDDPAWRDRAFKPFVSSTSVGDSVVHYRPNRDSNLSVAEFYGNALDTIRRQAERAKTQDYHGQVRLQSGISGTESHLYIWPYDGFAYSGPSIAYPGSQSAFNMGDDGRFHSPTDYNKVLRVDGNGYVLLGDMPANPAKDTNGVFQRDGSRFRHVQDGKFLTDWGYDKAVRVDSRTWPGYSDWITLNNKGAPVSPPLAFTYKNVVSQVGSPSEIFRFVTNPESVLPQGSTHFIVSMPPIRSDIIDTFASFRSQIDKARDRSYKGSPSVYRMARWLAKRNATLLFRDGYYATTNPDDPKRLEVRRLDGTLVLTGTADQKTHASHFVDVVRDPLDNPSSHLRVPDFIWDRIQDQQATRIRLAAQWPESVETAPMM